MRDIGTGVAATTGVPANPGNQNMNNKNRCGYLSLPVLVTAVLTACAGNKSEPSDEFLSPISDQTIDLISQVHFGLQIGDSVQLNHYFNSDSPKVDAWVAVWDDLTLAMRAMVNFSAELVDIAESAEGPEAIDPLISVVASLNSDLHALPSAQPFAKEIDLQTIFITMREQETVIDAIRQAQPLVSEFSDVVIEMLAVADVALTEAVLEVGEKIESTHSPMLVYGDNLTARQNSTLKQLAILDRVWGGDESAWSELLASDWSLAAEIGSNARLSPATAMQAEQYLIDRLNAVATIRQHLEPASFAYQNELQELYQIEDQSEATLRVALLIIENWEKAQRQLARGEKGAFSEFTSSLMKVVYRRAIY